MEEQKKLLSNGGFANSDVDFCSFYYKAVKRLLDIDIKTNVSYLYRYAKILNKYCGFFGEEKVKRKDRDEAMMKLLKDSFYYRLIYIYRNATLLSSAVAFHFKNVCEQNPKCVKRIIKKKLIKICSIGGSSASDIVAIIKVLKSIASKSGTELDFRVAIVDLNADWRTTCIAVLGCLDEFHHATWKINFFASDLTNMWIMTKEMYAAIQDADVITMVKSTLELKLKQNIIKMLCSELKVQAMLLILDSPEANLIEFCFGMSDSDYLPLMHAELHDYHSLDIEAVKHFETLYRKHFTIEKCFKINVSLPLFACVLTKTKSETSSKQSHHLENVFQSYVEKYDPKPNFLCDNAFTRWKNSFTKQKEAAGWTAKRIKRAVLKEKGKRNNMFGKFIPQKKEVNSLQNYLLTQVQSSEKASGEANVPSFKDFLHQKKKYSSIKKNAYVASLSANKLYYMIK